MNIAIFASHGGSDLQAIIDGCRDGKIDARVPEREHSFLVEVIADIARGIIPLC